jgi:hypothetical protein
MLSVRYAALAVILVALPLAGCKKETVAEKHHPAKLEDTDQKGIKKVILEARAAERIGVETAAVREEVVQVAGAQVTRKVVPYGALLYDTKGNTWTFTNPEPLVYVRAPIVVDDIEGDRVLLSEGPPAGTAIVTVGAVELMGAEHKYGH